MGSSFFAKYTYSTMRDIKICFTFKGGTNNEKDNYVTESNNFEESGIG